MVLTIDHSFDSVAQENPYKARGRGDDDAASATEDGSGDQIDHAINMGDEHGEHLNIPEGSKQDQEEARKVRFFLSAGIESFKYLYSLVLLVFCVAMVMRAMFTGQTGAASFGIPPIAAFFIYWFLLFWLAMMEGGQGCLVGLQPIEKESYRESHPISIKNTALAHKGDNMERFILGRQFLVVLVVFVTNMMGAATKDAQVFGLPDIVNSIFLSTGLAMILTTIMIGQLTAQVNASDCMLDFINNYFMLFTNYISLFIELTGLVHSVYLVKIFFSKVTGTPIDSKEPPRSAGKSAFFWIRVLGSCIILGFSFAVTLKAIIDGNTTMWEGVPPIVSVIVLFALMAFVGMMEGMQIALFAVVKLPEEELAQYTMAAKTCELTFRGQNFSAFLIGRQICVTCCTFVIAKITSLDIKDGDENIFGVSDGVQGFFNTGLLGAVITTIIGSLAWRIIASSFPVPFLSNPLIYLIVRLNLLLEATGICSASWVLARWHKILAGFQPDEVYFEGIESLASEPPTRKDKDIDRLVVVIKYIYSLTLLVFSVSIIMAAIFTKQSAATARGVHPAAAFVIFWFLIFWLAMMEGGQGCLVGLQLIEKKIYGDSHPIALKNTAMAHKGDNMERFIIGRQFLVVLVVFVTNILGASTPGAKVLGLPHQVNDIMLGTGMAMILTTIMIGQLTAQVNATDCMLDFINNYFMLFTTYIALFIEISGLLHSVYLVQIMFSSITGQPIDSNESPRNAGQNAFFWIRVLFSLAILGFAFAVSLVALFDGNTTMWEGVPPVVSVIILFVLMAFVGLMEGMQIALFAVVNMPQDELVNHKVAYANCRLAFTGQNLQAFLIGRQICVTCCTFVIARITTLNIGEDDDNIFGVSDGLQGFFNTGLLGAVITTIVASLAWRIIASSFPLAFLSNPLIYVIIRLCLLLEATGICSASWVLARYQKVILGYQPDEIYLEDYFEPHGSEPVTRRDKDIDITVAAVKYTASLGILVFSVVLVMALIFSKQTKISSGVHPLLAFFIFWFLLLWLATIEGGQGCLVGLQPIDKDFYAQTHPVTLKNTLMAHKGDNMERFIVGRQFLVVLIVFVTNMCGAALPDSSVLDLPDEVLGIFLESGLAMILTTIIIGQLTTQVNAVNCMLDFINSYFMLFSTYVSLVIEVSGLLHSVYLVQIFFSKVTGQQIYSKEPPRSGAANALFWLRVIFSCAVLGFSFAVTLKALFDGNTTMWKGVPSGVSVVILFLLMAFVGMMEGMQIALYAVMNMPEEQVATSTIAMANCEISFHGNNFQALLIGRQICVTFCTFIVARITSLNIGDGVDNIFGVSDGVQGFFNTGLLGAVITTIIGSLMWRIIASSFPLAFLSNPLIYLIIRLCLFLESTGICSSAWLLAIIHKKIVGLQLDEVYIGTSEERAARKQDKEVEA